MLQNTSLLICFCLLGVAVAAIRPQQRHHYKRDVAEITPVSNYLPPEEATTEAAPPLTTPDDSEVLEVTTAPVDADQQTVLGANGYEYRVVRKLRRRDVSHLNLGYLPPPAKPQKVYLPPVSNAVPSNDAFVPPATASLQTHEHEGEVPTPVLAEAAAAEDSKEAAAPASAANTPEETAVFGVDGYHYKKPEVQPDLGFVKQAPEPTSVVEAAEIITVTQPEPEPEPKLVVEPATEATPKNGYLPPPEKSVVEAVGKDGESAALADDGYHYRVVKSAHFF